MIQLRALLTYFIAGTIAILAAFLIAVQFLRPSFAQDGDSGTQEISLPQTESSETERPPVGTQLAPTQSSAGTELMEIEGFLQPYIYDVTNRRDPFEIYPDFIPTSAPLNADTGFSLDQLKLVGIMWDVKKPKALFQLPTNEVRIYGRDESIGNRDGYVATIREGEVVVVETSNRKGETIYRTRVLRIER